MKCKFGEHNLLAEDFFQTSPGHSSLSYVLSFVIISEADFGLSEFCLNRQNRSLFGSWGCVGRICARMGSHQLQAGSAHTDLTSGSRDSLQLHRELCLSWQPWLRRLGLQKSSFLTEDDPSVFTGSVLVCRFLEFAHAAVPLAGCKKALQNKQASSPAGRGLTICCFSRPTRYPGSASFFRVLPYSRVCLGFEKKCYLRNNFQFWPVLSCCVCVIVF